MKSKTFMKFMSVFLAVAIVLCSAPLSGLVGIRFPGFEMPEWLDFDLKAEAEENTYRGSCGESVSWSFDTGTGVLDITGTGAMDVYSFSVNAPWYSYRSLIETVNIAPGVTTIGALAFYNCANVTSITIPDSVTSMGFYAFSGCSRLEKIYYTGSINLWSGIVFDGADSNPFTRADNLYVNGVLQTEVEIIVPENVTQISSYAFMGCKWLKSVVIPATVKGIGSSAFDNCTNLTAFMVDNENVFYSNDEQGNLFNKNQTVLIKYVCGESSYSIPYGVTRIGDGAFKGYTSLVSVWIPESVTEINNSAFENCTSLESITIPDSVKKSGLYLFRNCTNLISVRLSENITSLRSETFKNCTKLTSLTIPDKVTSIGMDAFSGCNSLATITIPDSVTNIDSGAFRNCIKLSSITIPDSITKIGTSAFYGCSALETVVMGNGVTKLEDYLFYNCKGLKTVSLSQNLTGIDNCAFSGCSALDSVIIPDGVTTIGTDAFRDCTSLTSVIIPDSVTDIGAMVFRDCASLTDITIGSSVTSIGSHAFYGCPKLENVNFTGDIASWCSITFTDYYSTPLYYTGNFYINGVLQTDIVIPDTVTEIKKYTFYGCESISSVSLGRNTTSIGEYAFCRCKSIASLMIPDSVKTIGAYAYQECTGITAAVLGESVESIGNNAFYSCSSLVSVNFPDSVESIGAYAFNTCTKLRSVEIPDSVTHIGEYAFAHGYSIKTVKIGDGVECINTGVFYCCNHISSVEFGKNITSIGDYAFNTSYCNLESITLPDSVTEIGKYAFGNCYNLIRIDFNKNLKTIGECAFYGCRSLDGIEIPDSVTTIEKQAFAYNKNLRSITLHKSIENIGEDVFKGSVVFSDIYYVGFEEEWNAITINSQNRELFNANLHFLKNIVDDDTDVEIRHEGDIYEDGTDVDAVVIPDDGQIMLTNDHKKKTNAVIYDISTIRDNMVVQPNGKVKVSIPAPEGYKNSKIFIFHIDNTINGKEWIPARIINGYVVFEVTHFSLYAVADLDFTFSLNKSTATVTDKNKTVKLSPVIDSEIALSGYTVQWLSNDEAVATVDENGVVTRVGDGECTITAIFNEDTTKLAKCSITSVGEAETEFDIIDNIKSIRGSVSMKSYKGEDYIAITMTPGNTVTGVYKDMTDGGKVELINVCGTIQNRANDYVAYQSQNKTNPVATMKVTFADGMVETYPVVFEIYEMEREINFNPTEKIKPIRGNVSMGKDVKGDYILVEMCEGQSSVGVYKTSLDGTAATLVGAEGMFTEQEKLYIFYGSQNTINPEGRLTVTEADGSMKTYRIVFKLYETDPYVNVAKGLRPIRGAVTFDSDRTLRIKMTSGQTSVGLYKTTANGATFKLVDANGRATNHPGSIMFYKSANVANVTATIVFTLPDGTTKEQKIIFDMGLASDPDPLLFLAPVRGAVSYQNDGTESYIEVKANALTSGVGLKKDCLVKYTITDADGIITEDANRYFVYKSQNPDGVAANINFLQSDGSYKTYKVNFVF